jgi:alpha-galactosidase
MIMPTGDIIKEWIDYQFPCSFRYDGRDSEAFLARWERVDETKDTLVEGNPVTEHSMTWRDQATGIACSICAREFPGFPAIDWIIEFENEGPADTPILEDVHVIDWVWETGSADVPVLHTAKGSNCEIDDFIPRSQLLKHWQTVTLSGVNGRPSVTSLPFFCLQQPAGGGVFVGIGWTGQWSCEISLHKPELQSLAEVSIVAGMERTHLLLHPGEKIRTPRILVLFTDVNRDTGQNEWRRLMLAYYSPHVGTPDSPSGRHRATVPLCYPNWGGVPVREHLDRIKMITEKGLAHEYYWIDAAWFIDESETKFDELTGSWARHVGRWRPNQLLYPNGLRPISDAAHAAGLKFLLWMEPERARGGSEWPQAFPEFFLERHPQPGSAKFVAQDNVLFNLGNPEARQFLIEFVCGFIEESGIDCFRQDFNIDPLDFWRANDAPDRQGMTEIMHVLGLYQFWDELRTRFPDLVIDNCASGGRRIDLETIQRAIPLWRSDYQCVVTADPIGAQVATAGLMAWAPLSSTGSQNHPGDDYAIRSAYSSGLVFHHGAPPHVNERGEVESKGFDPDTYPFDWHRRMVEEFGRVRPFFEGDCYLLSNCTASTYDWLAIQCNRPDLGEGIVLAFRRQDSPYMQARFRLRGLDPAKRYAVENVDTGEVQELAGEDLVTTGGLFTLPEPRSSALYMYRKISCFFF